MQAIDAHVHLYPPEIAVNPAAWAATCGERHWAKLCTRRRADGRAVQGFPSVDELLREMDRADVARAVLLGWYWEKPETCAWQNRFYADCVRAHPDRLDAFATLHPRGDHGGVLGEIQFAYDAGLIGLGELSPHSQGYTIDDPVFCAALTRAGELKLPVNLHVTDPAGRTYPGRIETPLADFSRLTREFPAVTFILAHWGGLLPLRDESARNLANVFYDTAASPLMYGPDIWSRFLAVMPAERVLFGSDYPLNLYPKLDADPAMTRLIDEAKTGGAGEAVLRGNATRLLKR